MESSSYQRNITARLLALAGAVGAVTVAFLASSGAARAQVVTPLKNTEEPSQNNPFPKAGGDAQNRGRAHDDKYWGVTDSNRPWSEPVFARLPGSGPLVVDGWTFPARAGDDINRAAIVVNNNPGATGIRYPFPSLTPPIPANQAGAIGFTDAPPSVWRDQAATLGRLSTGLVTGPSITQPGDNDYQRAIAVPRPNVVAINYGQENKFSWYPRVPGAAGTMRRYSIRVYIPQVEPPRDATVTDPFENRISDARYVVFYHVLLPGGAGVQNRSKVCRLVSQEIEGYQTLVDEDGSEAFFPMFSEATYANPPAGLPAGLQRARVELDNTTEDDVTDKYVIADQIQFVAQQDTVRATPTVTPRKSGRMVARNDAATRNSDLYEQTYQPQAGVGAALPGERTYVLPAAPARNPDEYRVPTANGPALLNDSFAFANNPRDPIYYPADIGTNPTFVPPNSPYYVPFDASEPAALFQGPTALIDPRGTLGQVVNGASATNFERYPAPMFSHMQVILARTEFVQDPNDFKDLPVGNQFDGTGTVEVGAVYSLDWLTGTVLWRFPDRTHLPALTIRADNTVGAPTDPRGNVIPGAGLRNPVNPLAGDQTVAANRDPNNLQPITLIPGIASYDKNLDGYISDDEVFIGPAGANRGGGISSAVTLAPGVQVQGTAQIPTYNVNFDPYTAPNALTAASGAINGVVNAPEGRYATPVDPADPLGGRSPVNIPVAYVASNNGVIYAIDPQGNNDNQYYPARNAGGTLTPLTPGEFRAGTTNLLWTFSAQIVPRFVDTDNVGANNSELLEDYFKRLKQSIPETDSFGTSAPVIAYELEDVDPSLNRDTQEPRLFVGNSNGVMYALDARAVAGKGVNNALLRLPFRKGEQPITAGPPNRLLTDEAARHRTELKWWFEAENAIVSSAAVSVKQAFKENKGDAANDPSIDINGVVTAIVSKGVYFTALDGRVYCVDWLGPVRAAIPHINSVTWNGVAGNPESLTPDQNSATELNDNFRFHNDNAARDLAQADGTEGTIRPRWAFPQRYRDIDGVDIGGAGDNSILIPRKPADASRAVSGTLAEPDSLGPIYSSPSLMDFVWDDPATAAIDPVVKSYVIVTANDRAATNEPARQGRIYLLDQAGNRRDFLNNPVTRTDAGPPSTTIAFGQPLDRYTPTDFVMGKATPAWTYRSQYDLYDPLGQPIMNERNSPRAAAVGQPVLLPSKRTLPTVYAGGVGRLFAIDIDPATGLFMRWRGSVLEPNEGAQRAMGPMPRRNGGTGFGFSFPPAEPNGNRLNPVNPAVIAANLTNFQIFARTVKTGGDTSSVDGSITITGGPRANRNNPVSTGATGRPRIPTVPPLPTNDAPNLAPPTVAINDPLSPTPTNIDTPGRFVNQEIGDGIATTRGSFAVTPADTTNRAYQFPSLFVTTAAGNILEISTNIEGEDSSTLNDPLYNETSALGWSLTNDLERFNVNEHVLLYLAVAPGGPGTGVGIFTNAYFPSLDPRYRNGRAKPPTAGYPADPTAPYPLYPPQEPNIAARTDAPLPADTRPDFQPRGLYAGDALDPGPNGTLGDADDILTPPDLHTGQTGFPLDLNGLFFDKAFARVPGAATVTPITETNDDGRVRLPGYSGIGTKAPNTPRASDDVANQLPREVTAADGTVTLFPTDDINPAAQNAVWILSGGANGVLYAITPAIGGITTPGEGGPSGLGAGGGFGYDGYRGSEEVRGPRGELTGDPKIDIFSRADFDLLLAAARGGAPIRPDRDGRMQGSGLGGTYENNFRSRIFANKKNFFEWGETVYLVAYDVLAADSSIRVRIVNPLNNAVVLDRPVALERVTATGVVSAYDYVAGITVPPVPPADSANPGQLGLAFVRFTLDGSNSNTPGAFLEASVQASRGRGLTQNGDNLFEFTGGANSTQILNNINPVFSIANPIALQAFVSNTDDNLPAALNVTGAERPLANAIGPFRADDGETAASIKNNIRDISNPPVSGTNDPDKAGSEYSQALANGNQIVRLNLNPYLTSGGVITTPVQRNELVTQRITNASGEVEPDYYIPIAAGAGYANHNDTGRTDLGPNRRNFRIINRSLLENLTRVRVEPMGDLIWRAWPGRKMNVDATDTLAGANPRLTPVGMRGDGIINPLPWEQPIIEPQPWKQNIVQFTPTGTIQARGNPSQDYRDIALQSADKGSQRFIVDAASGNIAQTRGTFTASLTGPPDARTGNLSLITGAADIANPFALSTSPFMQQYGVNIQVKIPKYQPANLVAAHSLTSTYVPPSIVDDPLTTTASGPTQLPRDITQRYLQRVNGGGASIAPFGYTTRVRVFVDSNPNGTWDINEAYREAEVWVGVPVDMSLKAVEQQVDLGALPQGFGIDNGALGYGIGAFPFNTGFLPPVETLANTLPNYYSKFFKPFSIQNTGNVNLYNLRASQKFSPRADGGDFLYFGMLSDRSDPRFGLMAAGADPNAAINVRSQVVTSLDRMYDGMLDAAVQATPEYQLQSVDPADGQLKTRYVRYYQGFGGAHTLHKPLVGATSPTVLSIPDVPSVLLQPTRDASGSPILLQPRTDFPRIGISVPIGTPSGLYLSQLGTPPYSTFNSPFAVFEDHDTNNAYAAAPRPNGSGTGLQILPAGPLYGGRNSLHPNSQNSALGLNPVPILPTSGQTILRPRGGNAQRSEYLPYTNPTIRLQATVTEAALTGQIVDQVAGGGFANSITTGVLPFIDPFPLIESTPAGNRAVASGSPAAYRHYLNGGLHVYYVANASADGNRTPKTQPGQPFKLFHSHLQWDATVGTWVPANAGAPVVTANVNAGRWFSDPVAVETTNTGAANESNLTPFVLNDPRLQGTPGAATLFFLNSAPTAGGAPVNQIYFAPLTDQGVPGTPQTFLQGADASIVRYGPRAVFAPTVSGIATPTAPTTIALYAGRSAGGFTLFYAAAQGNPGGTGRARQERALAGLPTGLTSATEPSGVFRHITGADGVTRSYVDVYYTGLLRSAQNPDVFMSRFAVTGGGQGAQLRAASLPRVERELAVSTGRDPIWRTQHVGWSRSLAAADRPRLPIVYIGNNVVGTQTGWKIDAASGLLYQAISLGTPAKTAYIYADTGTGVITFRGPNIPRPGSSGDVISVSYSPTAYRVTTDGAADASAIGFADRSFAPATPATVRNSVRTRIGDFGTVNGPQGIDRQYLFWQKGARTPAAPTLFYTAKRVGVDLRSIPINPPTTTAASSLQTTESISLTAQDATTGNQTPEVTLTVNGVAVPYEVDYTNGRIYFEGLYEGLTASITYRAFNNETKLVRDVTAQATLTLIDEIAASEGGVGGRAVPTQQAVNEAQPYAFLDLYDGTGIPRPVNQGYPQSSSDPTLRPGRVWMFWTSPRARQGVPRTQANPTGVGIPSGYDIYWQTLAPYFESPSFSGLPPK